MSGIYDYIVQSFHKDKNIILNDNKTVLNDKAVLNKNNSSEIIKINDKEINPTNENLSMNDFFKSASYIIAYMMDDYSTTLVDVVS